jgi:predicted DNA-binding transcriptional regulator AlpA
MTTQATTAASYPIARDPRDRIVRMPEACTISGLSADTLKRCAARNELRILKLSPRRIGIWLSDLQAFVDGRAA